MENTLLRSTLNNYTKIMKRAKTSKTSYWYYKPYQHSATCWSVFKTSGLIPLTSYWSTKPFIATATCWSVFKTSGLIPLTSKLQKFWADPTL